MPIHSLKFSITNISILINGISCALINDNKLVYFLKEIEVVYCKYEISLTGTFLFPWILYVPCCPIIICF